jgi:hypothetical protein
MTAPVPTSMVEAMRENVAEARDRYEKAIDTLGRARAQGMIVTDQGTGALHGTDAEGHGERYIGAARQALAELNHWHGYLTQALKDAGAPPPPPIERRPPAPAAPDTRLPPERELFEDVTD